MLPVFPAAGLRELAQTLLAQEGGAVGLGTSAGRGTKTKTGCQTASQQGLETGRAEISRGCQGKWDEMQCAFAASSPKGNVSGARAELLSKSGATQVHLLPLADRCCPVISDKTSGLCSVPIS